MIAFYTIVEALPGLSNEELRRLKEAISREATARDHRAMADQLNLLETTEGQADFENELIKARRKGRRPTS